MFCLSPVPRGASDPAPGAPCSHPAAPAERDSAAGPGERGGPFPGSILSRHLLSQPLLRLDPCPGRRTAGGWDVSLPSFIKGPRGGGRAPGGYFWEQLLGSDGLVRAALTFLPAGEESGPGRGGRRGRAGERDRPGTPIPPCAAGTGTPSPCPPRGPGPPSLRVPRGGSPGGPCPCPCPRGRYRRSCCPYGGAGARPALLPSLSSNFSLLPCPSPSAGPGEAGAAAVGAQPVPSGDAGAPERCPGERCPAEGHRRAP